ncbi:hypothetical protein [Streptomyces sp. H27-C3]|uniref:hypothetical protein n=1 Tax=Streptomyces sp. H27-C3 TaxID=3046305 RepID=UPI0024B8C10E|nr:hypothetical protein [Streptomyces sp. H27-C3]MDJ0460612.1 hypothetical protein [Streptomyces sp. H27-C3]
MATSARTAPLLVLTRLTGPDTARVREILRSVCDRLESMNRHTAMRENTRFIEAQLAVWDHHGDYNSSPAVGRDIVATLTALRDLPLDGTRADYADRLRLALGAVCL